MDQQAKIPEQTEGVCNGIPMNPQLISEPVGFLGKVKYPSQLGGLGGPGFTFVSQPLTLGLAALATVSGPLAWTLMMFCSTLIQSSRMLGESAVR